MPVFVRGIFEIKMPMRIDRGLTVLIVFSDIHFVFCPYCVESLMLNDCFFFSRKVGHTINFVFSPSLIFTSLSHPFFFSSYNSAKYLLFFLVFNSYFSRSRSRDDEEKQKRKECPLLSLLFFFFPLIFSSNLHQCIHMYIRYVLCKKWISFLFLKCVFSCKCKKRAFLYAFTCIVV